MSSRAETEHMMEPRRPHTRNKRDKVQRDNNLVDNKITEHIAESGNVPSKNSESIKITTASSQVQEKINCSQLNNKTGCSNSIVQLQDNDYFKSVIDEMNKRGMLLRTLYVTLGVTGIVVVYFVLRFVWLRRKSIKSRKYGVTTQRGNHSDMEMEPLGDGNDDDDDDDYTVFEASGRKK